MYKYIQIINNLSSRTLGHTKLLALCIHILGIQPTVDQKY